MAEQDSEKTEQASSKRQQEAREKGQVARSQEIPSVAVLLMGTVVMYFIFPRIYSNFLDFTSNILSASGSMQITEETLYPFWISIVKRLFFTMSPFLLMIVIAGVASNILQFGFIFSPKSLEFNLSRLNPLEGVKRIISLRALIDLTKAVLKIVIIGYTAYLLIRREIDKFPILVDTDVHYILSYTGWLTLRLMTWTGAVLVLLAAIDFGFNKWEYTKRLRMTRQGMKQDFRES